MLRSREHGGELAADIYRPSRRTILRLGATCAAWFGVERFLQWDDATVERFWPPNHTAVELLPGQEELLPATEGWAVLPGLGHADGYDIATNLQPAIPDSQPISYMRYANQGIHIPEAAQELARFSSSVDVLNVYGHSMGTVTFMKAWAWLHQPEGQRWLDKEGILLPPVGQIIMNCSPFDLDDAHQSAEGHVVAAMPKGGMVGKAIVEAGSRIINSTPQEWPAAVAEAWAHLKKGAPPRLWQSQLKLLAHADLEHDQESLNFTGAHVAFVQPRDALEDQVVNDPRALRKWRKFFGHYDIKIERLLVSNTRHADTARALSVVDRFTTKHELAA